MSGMLENSGVTGAGWAAARLSSISAVTSCRSVSGSTSPSLLGVHSRTIYVGHVGEQRGDRRRLGGGEAVLDQRGHQLPLGQRIDLALALGRPFADDLCRACWRTAG